MRSFVNVGAPLRHRAFRNIWLASVLCNVGLTIQGVGAAWAMTLMTSSADMVALVQTAWMMPTVFLSLISGAIADMYDRRVVSLWALVLGLAGAVSLSVLWSFGVVTPYMLLGFTLIIGTSQALFAPAWQSSVVEQVPADTLAPAIALNTISFNVARSLGPALGGVIVAVAGAFAAFLTNAILYVPLLLVLYFWQREREPSRLPPERLQRAIVSGVRYIINSPALRIVLVRAIATSLCASAVYALMPLIARDILGGGAPTFGLLLGAFGLGAVAAGLLINEIRRRIAGETSARVGAVIAGAGMAVAATSQSIALSTVAIVVTGFMWMMIVAQLNIALQLASPRWVSGRALAGFQTSVAAGIGLGGWGWGHLADVIGVNNSLMLAAVAMLISPLLGLWLRVPAVERADGVTEVLADPEVALSITPRSGPIVMELEYRVDPAKARAFYDVMQKVQLSRRRNGAYGWSIARDIANPEIWIERYHCPTWLDYLRMRNRPTQAERELQKTASEFHWGPEPLRIRRMLERPFGSVRWKDDTPDRNLPVMAQAPPTANT